MDQETEEQETPLRGRAVGQGRRPGQGAGSRQTGITMPRVWVSGQTLLADRNASAGGAVFGRDSIDRVTGDSERRYSALATENASDAFSDDADRSANQGLRVDSAHGNDDDNDAAFRATRSRVAAAMFAAQAVEACPLSPSDSSNDSVVATAQLNASRGGGSAGQHGRARTGGRNRRQPNRQPGDPLGAYSHAAPTRGAGDQTDAGNLCDLSESESVASQDSLASMSTASDHHMHGAQAVYETVPHDETVCGLCIINNVPLPRECEPIMLAVEDTIQSKLPTMRSCDAVHMIYDLYWKKIRPEIARVYPDHYRRIVPRMTHAQIQAHLNSLASKNVYLHINKTMEEYTALCNVLFDNLVYTVPVDPYGMGGGPGGAEPDDMGLDDPRQQQQQGQMLPPAPAVSKPKGVDYKNWMMYMRTKQELLKLHTTDMRKLMPNLPESEIVRAQIQRSRANAIVMPRFLVNNIFGSGAPNPNAPQQ